MAVRGERIVAVGPRAEIDGSFQAEAAPGPPRRHDRARPHQHPHARAHVAVPRHRRRPALQDWLEKYIFPAEAKNVNAEFVRWGTRLACLEMVLCGTTTYADMYYFEDVVAEATKEAGMRGVLGETIIGFPVPDAKTPADGAGVHRDVSSSASSDDPLIIAAVAPHALYTNSDETLKAAPRAGQPLRRAAADPPLRDQDARTTSCAPSAA